jgi:hypothetical protein
MSYPDREKGGEFMYQTTLRHIVEESDIHNIRVALFPRRYADSFAVHDTRSVGTQPRM